VDCFPESHEGSLFVLDAVADPARKLLPPASNEVFVRAYAFALHHRVLPCLEQALANQGLQAPKEIQTKIGWYSSQSRKHQDALFTALYDITVAFNREGVRFTVIKTPAMLLVHPEISRTRFISDLDLLVSTRHIQRASQVLQTLGFNLEHRPLRVSQRELHHHAMYSADRDVIVELHWDIAAPWHGFSFDLERLFKRSRSVIFRDVSVRTPGFEDEFAIIVLDLAKGDWTTLKKLLAFRDLFRTYGGNQQAALEGIARTMRIRRKFYTCVLICHNLGLFTTPSPALASALLDPVAKRIAECCAARVLRCGPPEFRLARMREGLLFARKHDTAAGAIRHVWSIIVLQRLKRWLGRTTRKEWIDVDQEA
jgi:hypothetical protein